jgi:hypothetical protein
MGFLGASQRSVQQLALVLVEQAFLSLSGRAQ